MISQSELDDDFMERYVIPAVKHLAEVANKAIKENRPIVFKTKAEAEVFNSLCPDLFAHSEEE